MHKKRHTLIQYIRYAVSLLKKEYASIVGHIFYDKRYLTGDYFEKFKYTDGWRWVLQDVFIQKIIGYQKQIPFPVSFRSQYMNWENIIFDINDIDNFQKGGCYFQAAADAYIHIGRGTYIAPNVGLITSNHDLYDLDKEAPGKDIVLGNNCWIGMNCVILPGVHLGDHTVVGAGSIVTQSFPDGSCVIAGNPAKVIKLL